MAIHHHPQFTAEEIDQIIQKSTTYYQGGLSAYRPADYEGLKGRELTLRYDNGVTVRYAFADTRRLTWAQDGGDPKPERYEALTADDNIVLFVHLIEGSRPQESRIVVWDTDTNLVTTFFCKLGNAVSTREVDRDIVFGYADTGGDAPAARHCLTEELVGRSIIWTYSREFIIQHIYASKWYSCFADFNTFYGGQLLDSPCNYVKINDHIYIYSWVETDGAGMQGFALMNLHTMHDVGCFFGISLETKFEFYTFGAYGEYAGQLTNLNLPNDVCPGGASVTAVPPPGAEDGKLHPYRPGRITRELTEAEAADIAAKSTDWQTGDLIGRRPAFTDRLAGRTLTFHYDDGPCYEHRFLDAHTLQWREGDGEWKKETYEAFEMDDQVYFIAYLRGGSRPATSLSCVADLKLNLTTLILSSVGTEASARDVRQRIYHGVVEGEGIRPPVAWRHHLTRDLTGLSMGWSYRDDLSSQHIFGTPHSIAWVILKGRGTGLLGCAPCKYVKISDSLYLYSWVESRGSGQQGTVLVNLKTMHDCGTFFGINSDQRFEFYTYGARGYNLGGYNTRGKFTL